MARYVIIVARGQPDLYNHLAREFSGDKDVAVLLDRRRERRQDAQTHEPERRQGERRSQPRITGGLRSLGAVVTRTQQEAPAG